MREEEVKKKTVSVNLLDLVGRMCLHCVFGAQRRPSVSQWDEAKKMKTSMEWAQARAVTARKSVNGVRGCCWRVLASAITMMMWWWRWWQWLWCITMACSVYARLICSAYSIHHCESVEVILVRAPFHVLSQCTHHEGVDGFVSIRLAVLSCRSHDFGKLFAWFLEFS